MEVKRKRNDSPMTVHDRIVTSPQYYPDFASKSYLGTTARAHTEMLPGALANGDGRRVGGGDACASQGRMSRGIVPALRVSLAKDLDVDGDVCEWETMEEAREEGEWT